MARRRLIGDLTAAGVYEAAAGDAGLVLSELISNALRHATPLAGANVRVAWRLSGDCVEIAVSDGGGPTVPEVNEPGSSAVGGRGLGIVERLSLRWGVYPSADGAGEMTVWAEITLRTDAEAEHADAGQAGTTAASGAHGHRSGAPGLVIASSRDA